MKFQAVFVLGDYTALLLLVTRLLDFPDCHEIDNLKIDSIGGQFDSHRYSGKRDAPRECFCKYRVPSRDILSFGMHHLELLKCGTSSQGGLLNR
jgi:hypothetical protein